MAVREHSAQKHVVVADKVPGMLGAGRDEGPYLGAQLRADFFVRVDIENPVVRERQIFETPLLLLRVLSVPPECDDLPAHALGDRARPVCAAGIDDEHFREVPHRAQALRDILLFVLRHHDD